MSGGIRLDRGASPDLTWLAQVLWGGLEGVWVTSGDAPGKGRAVEQYVIVPNARRPRMLMPVARVAARAALAAGNALRPPATRAARSLAGYAGFAFRDHLTVSVEDGSAGAASTPAAVLGIALGAEVVLAVNVRPPTPFRKPVAQVLTEDGELIGYAKVAWNDLTERNVAAEADALVANAAAGITVGSPSLRARLSFRERTLLLADPLPAGIKRYRADAGAPDPALTREVAAVGGLTNGPARTFLSGVGERVEAARESRVAPGVVNACLDLLGALEQSEHQELAYGRWHGDWSPWNLGVADARLFAWDWEFSRAQVPLGLDIPHFSFQTMFLGRRRSLAEAFARARGEGEPLLEAAGCTRSQARLTCSLHVAEVAARYLDAMVFGALPNARFLAEAADVLRAESRRRPT